MSGKVVGRYTQGADAPARPAKVKESQWGIS